MIRTPKGKRITSGRYLALARANRRACRLGHSFCAAWDGGPCAERVEMVDHSARDIRELTKDDNEGGAS